MVGLGLIVASVGVVDRARADCRDVAAVTNDRCDQGDRAAGRRPAEDWGSYYERRQREVMREYDRDGTRGGRDWH